MSNITTLSINDGTTAQSFSPVSTNGNKVLFVDRASSTTSNGMHSLETNFSPASSRRRTDRVTVNLNLPVEGQGDLAGTYPDTARAQVTIVIPGDMPAADRTVLANLLKNSLAHADIQKHITDLEPFW